MRIGAFELHEPVPELHEPHALAMLDPWIDVGSVGTLTLAWLERHFEAEEIGNIARPGSFFDFTRYRPTIYYDDEDRRQIAVPNTYVTSARRTEGNDFLFLHLLEPHNNSEFYVESVVRLLSWFGVKRYCLLGSMYDYVPHTLPLLVTGGSTSRQAVPELNKLGIESSRYEGPTTIASLISQRALELGIETMSLIVHLPQYTQLDDDYTGAARLMDVVAPLYGLPRDNDYYERAERQIEEVNQALTKNPQLRAIVKEMEAQYGERQKTKPEERRARLSPEVERFLSEMEGRFREDQGRG